MPKFFIDRPIFAWVLAIMVSLAGILSIMEMPIEQFPKIAPPTISIAAVMPGASAETVEKMVTQVIEQSLVGLDKMRYFSSSSSSAGTSTIIITFEPDVDPDVAQVQVQNKLSESLSDLPISVQQQGLSVTKANNNFLIVIGLYSKTGATSELELGDVLSGSIRDNIARIDGVGDVTLFGLSRAMRIWLKPEKLYSYSLSANDIVNAIKAQNIEVPAGQLGGLPSPKGQQINATIRATSILQTVPEFERIILKTKQDGGIVRLKDVADVEIGAESYSTMARYKRKPAAGMAVALASGANALKISRKIETKMKELRATLPEDIEIIYPYDSIPFIKISIEKVVHTLVEAFVLVFIIIFLFLQNFRATLIPSLAIPVVLLGTFAVLNAFGFSINTLTMFAMVLSIGLLVDDAIVVVENVERIMHEEGLSPLEATRKSMGQIQGALVGIAVVLSAVFVPMAFFSGSAGAIYRQFSITVVTSMALSVFVALIFSPPLCAILLKKTEEKSKLTDNKFFHFFNRSMDKSRDFYSTSSDYILVKIVRFILIYVVMLGGIAFLFMRIPTSFLPNEDQGSMYLMVQSPTGATAERTLETVEKVEDYFLDKEGESVSDLFTVVGFSFAGVAQNTAFGFIGLKNWEERKRADQSVFAISGRAMRSLSGIKDAIVFTFFPPPIRELGNASGFDMQLLDTAGLGHEALMKARNQLLGTASQNQNLIGVRPNGLDDVAQFKIDIDYEKASSLGLSIGEINSTLTIALGSAFVSNFLDMGRVKDVYVQGIANARSAPEDLKKWYVKSGSGAMVPLTSFTSSRWVSGSPKLERFNGVSSINIQGSAAPGVSSGTAMSIMENIVPGLPGNVTFAWQGISYEEKAAGSKTAFLYSLSILIVFLALAALYESWSIPFSVLLVVPFGFMGALIAAKLAGLSNDIYFQIALLTTVGLSAKNAILIVEFAKELEHAGTSVKDSVSIALKQRFRPILMTSMAFVLGVLPMAIAHGAGSNAQNAIGISVIGGMMFATFVAPLFVPAFYIMILKVTRKGDI